MSCSVISDDKSKVLLIKNIRYKNFNSMIQLCRYERQGHSKRTKFKLQTSSKNPEDYKHIPNGQCGEINGEPIYIVQRKSTVTDNTTSYNTFFNYLYNGVILSKYDFISCFSFVNENHEYKARAVAGRTNWYWVYPNGKLKKIDSHIVREHKTDHQLNKKLSDDEYIQLLLERYNAHWHNLFK